MAKRKTAKNALHISLPATSANLGPAFDAAALAMDFYIKISARPAKEFCNHRDRARPGNLRRS